MLHITQNIKQIWIKYSLKILFWHFPNIYRFLFSVPVYSFLSWRSFFVNIFQHFWHLFSSYFLPLWSTVYTLLHPLKSMASGSGDGGGAVFFDISNAIAISRLNAMLNGKLCAHMLICSCLSPSSSWSSPLQFGARSHLF